MSKKNKKGYKLYDFKKSLLSNKCGCCGCYDGIHKADCLFMRRY